MKNKEQILVVPVNFVSYINNGFTGAIYFKHKNNYSLYDSTGVYKARYEVDNNICFIKIAIVMIFKHNEKFLVKELYDLNKRPCLELGINSYIKPLAGNNNAILNQMNYILNNDLKIDPESVKINFIGNIRDLANESVKSILGCIYYIDTTDVDMIISKSNIYQYKWYTLKELVDRYSKATSWSKKIIDCLLEETIKIN
jgi:predicted NUDIX family phosphoesterase